MITIAIITLLIFLILGVPVCFAIGLSGLSAAEMTAEAFTTIALVMSLCIMWGMVFSIFFNKKYLKRLGSPKSAKTGGAAGFGTVTVTGAQAVTLSGSFLSMYPYGVRLNVADGSVAWRRDRLLLEAEYQHLHYCKNAYRDVNAAVAFASYDVPVRWYPFNVLNFHGRWDYMGNHSTGKPDDNGVLLTDDPERQRMTFGASVRCNVKKVKAEFILDFEKYFYRHGVSAPRGLGDKICAEVVVSF